MEENKVQVINIEEGPKVAWEQDGTRITFGDDDLMLNVAKYQRNYDNHIDICRDQYGTLSMGMYYVAQLDIPAFRYPPQPESMEEVDPEPVEPYPLDMGQVTLTLWAIR